jgi:hypothetical protein
MGTIIVLLILATITLVAGVTSKTEDVRTSTTVKRNGSRSARLQVTAPWTDVMTLPTRAESSTVCTVGRRQARTDDPEVIASKIVAPYQRQAANFAYARLDNVTARTRRSPSARRSRSPLLHRVCDSTLSMLGEVEPDRATSARYAAELLKTKIAEQSVLTAEQEALRKVAEAAGADLDVLCVQAWPSQREAWRSTLTSPSSPGSANAPPTIT